MALEKHELPIDDPDRDIAHEAIIARTRDLSRRVKDAPPTSSLGKFRDRLRASLNESSLGRGPGFAPG